MIEQLTDIEQRIFLAAMAREEKVCKQTDDECRNCRAPYEDSLVKICHEITRKVKGALWTATPADVQPVRHGHWIFKTDRRIVDGYDWQCDQCKSWQRYTSNFCSCCGARMDG